MKFEGSYNLKKPCYTKELVGPFDPKNCTRGSLYVSSQQVTLAGDLTPFNKGLSTTDVFHRAGSETPRHMPIIDEKCFDDPTIQFCILQSVSVTENIYSIMDDINFGLLPNAAIEMQAKYLSRQAVHFHAGDKNADFNKLDNNDNMCQMLNMVALRWAMDYTDDQTLAKYKKSGMKLEMSTDLN